MLKLLVLCSVLAAAAAIAPFYPYVAPVPTLAAAPVGYFAPLLQPYYNYRGPLSLAPGQPANILAADGRPLDTIDVNLDRTAHFTAKALEHGAHNLQKRSVTRLAIAPGPVGFSAAVAAGNFGLTAPVTVNAYGVPASAAVAVPTPLVSGPIGITAPVAVGPNQVSAAISTNPVGLNGLSASIATNPIGIISPVARTF